MKAVATFLGHEVAAELSKKMGETWTFTPYEEGYVGVGTLTGPLVALYISRQWNDKDRVRVDVDLDRAKREGYVDRNISTYGLERPSISVSAERAPAAIAADLARRIIPAAHAYTVEVIKRTADHHARANRKLDTAKSLQAAAGGQGRITGSEKEEDYGLSVYLSGNKNGAHFPPSVDAMVGFYGEKPSISLDFHNLTQYQAEELLTLWANLVG